MSKLEVKEIGPISGETNLTLGQSGGTVTLADGATAVGFGGESPVKAFASVTKIPTYNVNYSSGFSSIVDVDSGRIRCNFSTPMPDANYAVAGCCNEPAAVTHVFHATDATTDGFTARTKDASSANKDTDYIGIMVAR